MNLKFWHPKIREDFVVIDSQFPQKEPLAFRNTEINEYFNRIENVHSYTMFPMLPDSDAWFTHGYGVTREGFDINKAGYLRHYPENDRKIRYLDRNADYDIKLSYSFFLGETYTLLPFYEQHKIPFVFVLYPGGCFDINVTKTDIMLKKIFNSPYFRGVLTTQKFTTDYLLSKKLCPPERITYVYGSFAQFTKPELKPKKYYKRDKQTFDICFVAAKYTEKGVDKGYDIFIETAKKLSKVSPDIRFHVVGGFTAEDIDVSAITDKITFYGYQRPDFLLDFYAGMDIFLSPNRPFQISKGNFDGFPLGIDAAYCGAALFIADELHLNHKYKNMEDIVIVPLGAAKISALVEHQLRNLDGFYTLAQKGQSLTQELFDTGYQIDERMKFFSKYVDLELKHQRESVKATVSGRA